MKDIDTLYNIVEYRRYHQYFLESALLPEAMIYCLHYSLYTLLDCSCARLSRVHSRGCCGIVAHFADSSYARHTHDRASFPWLARTVDGCHEGRPLVPTQRPWTVTVASSREWHPTHREPAGTATAAMTPHCARCPV